MTTTITLKKLIEEWKFDYVNSNITEKVFPLTEIRSSDYKLFHFDRYISSEEDAIKEMEKEGYLACNIFELLSWKDWNKKDWVIALGSVGEVGGGRHVPYLRRLGSERSLRLGWWDNDWNAGYRFLGVRTDSKNSLTRTSDSVLGNLDSVTLVLTQEEYKALKSALQKILK